MKKIIALFLTLAVTIVCVAQNKNSKERLKVDFYGVDFSMVNVIGAQDSNEKFIDAFEKINELLLAEQSKYDVGKYLKLDVMSTQINNAVKQLDKLTGVQFINRDSVAFSLKEIVASYPNTGGNILIIVAKELNKGTNKGVFISVVFDGTNKNILFEKEFAGKAGGFGLRNFWAGALYEGMKKSK